MIFFKLFGVPNRENLAKTVSLFSYCRETLADILAETMVRNLIKLMDIIDSFLFFFSNS